MLERTVPRTPAAVDADRPRPGSHTPEAIDAAVAGAGSRPRVLFLGKLYAGHRTRFENLRAHTTRDRRIRSRYRVVSGWVEGGAIERLPAIGRGLKGRLRGTAEAAALAVTPRPDAIWTSAGEVLLPFLWSQVGPLRRPMVLDLDWTLAQQESMASHYFSRPPKTGPRWTLARLQERLLWSRVTVFTPWSTWAADSLRRQGVPDERARVIPPGIDLEQWRPPPGGRRAGTGPLRLLFVGGDFVRKGGDLLIAAMRGTLRDRCELDIVTRDTVEPAPGVRVHRAEPNSDLLRRLYGEAEVFVMPTRAECFGIATIEAMASGLPVIVGDVGGVRDIVDDGETGWLIPPDGAALVAAVERAHAQRTTLAAMGEHGRRVAEARFDGRRNDERIVDLLVELAS
jgi:glycosyltransferase involved in cell wall biosynthesis